MLNYSDTNNTDFPDLSVKERIAQALSNIEEIIGKTPELVVLNIPTFEQWYDYCEERGLNPMTFGTVEIIIDPESICPYSFIITKNELVEKRLEQNSSGKTTNKINFS